MKIFRYGFWDILYLAYCVVRTKLTFSNARLIRFPIDIRQKSAIAIGKGFTTGRYCRIEVVGPSPEKNRKRIVIGSNVQINDSVHIACISGVTIADNVLLASKVFITDHNHGTYGTSSPETAPSQRELISKPVHIKENVWIGEFVSILPGVTVGRGSVIGTMSVVTSDIPDYCIAVGAPARVIKRFNFKSGQWEKEE